MRDRREQWCKMRTEGGKQREDGNEEGSGEESRNGYYYYQEPVK